MRQSALFIRIVMAGILVVSATAGFSQAQGTQNRIPQQIVINGQMANGAYVTASGGQIQSYTCPAPQHYTTADGSSQGWACYEQTTGVWLLNAVPPTQAQVAPSPAPAPAPPPPQVVQQPPTVIYQPAPPAVIYQPAPPAVIYQPAPAVVYQPPPATVIYTQPAPTTVVYAPEPRPVVVAPVYPSSVILGRAAIEAAGRVASAAILSSRHDRVYYSNYYYDYDRDRHHGRGHDRDRRW